MYSQDHWINSLAPGKCCCKLIIIVSDNGLSPERRQAIIWTNARLLLIGPLGTNFSEISIEISTFSLKKMHLKVSSAERRPFCLGLNVLIIFKLMYRIDSLSIFLLNCPQAYVTKPHWWLVKIDSSDGLVPSGSKPLPEPMRTNVYVPIWHCQAIMS